MRYTVLAFFNGRQHEYHAFNYYDAEHLYQVLRKDMTNGTVTMWTGFDMLLSCEVIEGVAHDHNVDK